MIDCQPVVDVNDLLTLRFCSSFNIECIPLTFQAVNRVALVSLELKLNKGPVLATAVFGAKKSNFGFFLVTPTVSLSSVLRLIDIVWNSIETRDSALVEKARDVRPLKNHLSFIHDLHNIMPVRMRLAMHGRRHRRIFHLVAINSRKARDAKPMETLGIYDPSMTLNEKHKTVEWSVNRIKYWLGVGATPSKTVVRLLEMVRSFGIVWEL